MATPFLKWAGGKRNLAPLIASRAPRLFGAYHEPFLGGGAVFFHLRAEGLVEPARLSDANGELIGCYEAVRDRPDALIAALRALAERHLGADGDGRREHYYSVRATVPDEAVSRAARLIFLNRTGYNGLYRVNAKGMFNVPYGRYVSPRILDESGIRAAAAALKGAALSVGSFEQACSTVQGGDFVYLDPPYVPLSATASFTQYTRGTFGPLQQESLRDSFERLTRAGAAILLSNSDHAAVRNLYGGRGYSCEVVSMSRAINSAGAKRQPVPELLIDNFGRPEVRARFHELVAGSSRQRQEL